MICTIKCNELHTLTIRDTYHVVITGNTKDGIDTDFLETLNEIITDFDRNHIERKIVALFFLKKKEKTVDRD